VGLSVIPGIALFGLTALVRKIANIGLEEHQEKRREAHSSRMQKTTEAFTNIKMLKLYCWEEKF
jgi:hypothetical protein